MRLLRPASCHPQRDFNPRTPCGVRLTQRNAGVTRDAFQSTHPLRGATQCTTCSRRACFSFQSTHPLRGATHGRCARLAQTQSNFNPRTPCGVRRKAPDDARAAAGISIHAPLAGCDAVCAASPTLRRHFNPRTPCGVRLPVTCARARARSISIHAPLAGCDAGVLSALLNMLLFQSTHPLRGATAKAARKQAERETISIHAPLAGCDECARETDVRLLHFNPRTPCGVRPGPRMVRADPENFNPRTPCGVRRLPTGENQPRRKISIHAPLAGCDEGRRFNKCRKIAISIHAPLAGCDSKSAQKNAALLRK